MQERSRLDILILFIENFPSSFDFLKISVNKVSEKMMHKAYTRKQEINHINQVWQGHRSEKIQ